MFHAVSTAGFVRGSFARRILAPLLGAVSALALAACGSDAAPRSATLATDESALVGGRAATAGEYPATLEIAGGCTAVKIGPRHLLLAAHCVHDPNANALSGAYVPGARIHVDAGVLSASGAAGADLTIAATHIFPAWTAACEAPCPVNVLAPAHPADVALIEVAEETPAIAEASLDPRPVKEGERVVLTGYGCENGLDKAFGPGAPRLKVDETSAVGAGALAHAGSIVAEGDAHVVAASYVVTAGNARDASSASLCFGDSGGPLYRDDGTERLVVGINAYYTFPLASAGVSQTNWHTRVDEAAPQGVLSWLVALGASVRRDVTTVSATPVPGVLQAEDYDRGGEGVGYHDADAANQGKKHRTDGVDLEATTDGGAGYDVGWTAPGEWLAYHVAVATTGAYDLALRVASPAHGKKLHVEVDGRDVNNPITIPTTNK